MTTRIFHNPRCSKSRQTLSLLNSRQIPVEVIEYLKNPIERPELEQLLGQLGCSVRDILRFNEPEFGASGLSKDAPEDALKDLLLAHPKLLQRPIVVHNNAARIGRPPELVLELFE